LIKPLHFEVLTSFSFKYSLCLLVRVLFASGQVWHFYAGCKRKGTLKLSIKHITATAMISSKIFSGGGFSISVGLVHPA
jgi:hypothetical protein